MGANTSVCFLVASIVLVLAGKLRTTKDNWLGLTLATTTIAIAGISLKGLFAEIELQYLLRQTTRMAPLTAMRFFVAGGGFAAYFMSLGGGPPEMSRIVIAVAAA